MTKSFRYRQDMQDKIRNSVQSDSNGCWLWQLGLFANGYGAIRWRGKQWKAHRLAWVAWHGAIPDGLQVRHGCDVRQCANPEHLFVGTALDNTRDAVQRGRLRHGAAHPVAKLNDVAVAVMRHLHSRGSHTIAELARAHGIEDTTAFYAIRRKTWKHVGGPPLTHRVHGVV